MTRCAVTEDLNRYLDAQDRAEEAAEEAEELAREKILDGDFDDLVEDIYDDANDDWESVSIEHKREWVADDGDTAAYLVESEQVELPEYGHDY